MPKEKVWEMMGRESFCTQMFCAYGTIQNPAAAEMIYLKGEPVYEVIYYFTQNGEGKSYDPKGMSTPFVFKGNVLIGWGRIFLQDLLKGTPEEIKIIEGRITNLSKGGNVIEYEKK